MTADEARLLAVLIEQAAHPGANADARARTTTDGWEVVLHWDQGPYSFGTRLTQVQSLSGDSTTTVDRLALEVGMDLIDEPHGPHGEVDQDGRYWLE